MAEPAPILHPPEPESETPWKAIGIGAALMVLLLAVVVWLGRGSGAPPPAVPDAYAANLELSNAKMHAAENFVGATVSYLDATLTNRGDRTVNLVTVEVVFKNSLGEVVQKETLPAHSLVSRGPYVDTEDLHLRPLHPGESRDFRLTFDHISQDWNHEYPALRIMTVRFQ